MESAIEKEGFVPVAENDLKYFCRKLLEKLDVPAEEAIIVTDNLVEADLRGVGSHGVMRLPVYKRRLQAKATNPRPRMKIIRETAQTAVFDGDNGLGHLVGVRAMELVIDKARTGEPTFVAVRRSNHFGTAAYYAQMAAQEEMVGFAFTIGGINHMTPWGGAEAKLGNNPFALAMPAGEEYPIVLDMACSVAARGKIMLAVQENVPIPGDWAVDVEGRPTTDAEAAMGGFVLPVGGPKGYALTLMIGLVSTMLSGAFFGSEVTHLYDDLENEQNTGHLFGALPIATFVDPDRYKARMDKAVREMRSARHAAGVERIYLPGEREYLTLEKRRAEGIPLNQATFDELNEIGAEFGLRMAAKG